MGAPVWSPQHRLLFVTEAVYGTGQDRCGNLHALREDLSAVWMRSREKQSGIGNLAVVGDTLVAESSHYTDYGHGCAPEGLLGLNARTGATVWRRSAPADAGRGREEQIIGAFGGTVVTKPWPVPA